MYLKSHLFLVMLNETARSIILKVIAKYCEALLWHSVCANYACLKSTLLSQMNDTKLKWQEVEWKTINGRYHSRNWQIWMHIKMKIFYRLINITFRSPGSRYITSRQATANPCFACLKSWNWTNQLGAIH